MADVDKNKSGIYQIINLVNNKIYIGSAIIFRKRWDLHILDLKNNRHHSRFLQASYNKYGKEAFSFSILEIVEDKTKLIEREQFWIDWSKPEYNICKIAESRLGVKSSPEHVAKIVAANLGKIRSKEQKEILRSLRLGAKLTEEQKQARRDYRHSEEAKLKISTAGKGRKHTDEAKARMSEKAKAIIHKPLSLETRAKLSAAAKQQWNRKFNHYITNNVSI